MNIRAINLKDRVAVTDTNVMCTITNLLDCDGDETEDYEFAVAFVVQLPGGRWASCSVAADYDMERLQALAVN